jgi:hypothetical protein
MKTPIQLTVALDATDSAVAALHRAVLASLPQRFLVTGKRVGECTDIVVVSGQEPFWMDRVGLALDAGAKGILLATPTAVDPAQMRALATGGLVVAVHAVRPRSKLGSRRIGHRRRRPERLADRQRSDRRGCDRELAFCRSGRANGPRSVATWIL